MSQELRLTTMFPAGTPSALWRHQVAGPTSPAWVRALALAAEEETEIRGRTANRSWRAWGTASWHQEPQTLHSAWPGHLPASIVRLLLRSFSPAPPPPPQTLILEDTVRNKTKKKREKNRNTPYLSTFFNCIIIFFLYRSFSLPCILFFFVFFTVVSIKGSSETKLNWHRWENRLIFVQDVHCIFISSSFLGVV